MPLYWPVSPHLKARQVAVRQCLRAPHPAHLRALSRVHRVPSLRAQEVRNRHKVPSQAALRAVVVRAPPLLAALEQAPVVQCLQYQARHKAANNKVPALVVLRPRMAVAVSLEVRTRPSVMVKAQYRGLNPVHSKVTQIKVTMAATQATTQVRMQELSPASLVISNLGQTAVATVHPVT